MAQLPVAEHGVDSGVAYFTTTSALPVRRLTELANSHPALRQRDAKSLTDNVHTCLTYTVPALISVLKHALSALIKQAESSKGKLRPIRVLILDSLGSLFHSMDKTTTTTLVERSRALGNIAYMLHDLASRRNMAIIVVNQAADVFNTPEDASSGHQETSEAPPVLMYKDQSLWFNRIPLVTSREAMLGLIWANQLNTRIMVTRTKRRMRTSTTNGNGTSNKRRKTTDVEKSEQFARLAAAWYLDEEEDEAETEVVIRKLAVVFSATSAPCVMDFIVVAEGVRVTEVNHTTTVTASSLPQAKAAARKDPSPKNTPVALPPGSQGFISARLTQVQPPPEDPPRDAAKEEEDFDVFDEAEWVTYGEVVGDLEEQWDTSESENQLAIPSDTEIDDDAVLESSDVEENLLL